jgi:deazaflavin-dependent oxidoreductase (nitroreductase family)
MLGWRAFNPLARRLAGTAPWWVVLETTGLRSGLERHTPLARGPHEGGAIWLISVHGRRAHWVRNLEADPAVRVKLGRRWRPGRATVERFDTERVRRFSSYAQAGPRVLGIEPVLVRVQLDLGAGRCRSPRPGQT